MLSQLLRGPGEFNFILLFAGKNMFTFITPCFQLSVVFSYLFSNRREEALDFLCKLSLGLE